MPLPTRRWPPIRSAGSLPGAAPRLWSAVPGFTSRALIYGLFEDGPSDPAVRHRLKQQADSEAPGALHRRLEAVDRAAAARIHPNDTYRIIRALEVFAVTGEPLTVFQQRHGFRERRFDTLEIGISLAPADSIRPYQPAG